MINNQLLNKKIFEETKRNYCTNPYTCIYFNTPENEARQFYVYDPTYNYLPTPQHVVDAMLNVLRSESDDILANIKPNLKVKPSNNENMPEYN